MGRLLDAADDVKPGRGGIRSYIDQWLDTLEPEDHGDALVVLRAPERFGHAHVSALIERVHGRRFTPATVLAWRKKNLG